MLRTHIARRSLAIAGGLLLMAAAACADDASTTTNTKVTCTPGPCQLAGTYQNGRCVNPNKPDGTACVDDNTCATDKSCNAGACIGTPLADGTACDDHNLCTQSAACAAGVCVGSDPLTCPPEDQCHYAGVCDPNKGCQSASKGPCNTQLNPVQLNGCPPGDYWAQVTLGGNQTLSLIADSGSSTLAVAANTCSNCSFAGCGATQKATAAVSPPYTPGTTAKDAQEQSSGTYGDNSGWQGAVYVDSVAGGSTTTPTSPAVSMRVAAITQSTDFFTPSYCVLDAPTCNTYQGILGLGGQSLVSSNTDAFIPRLAGNPNVANAFAVQLCNSGGRIWYGGYDPTALAGSPNFVPMLNSAYYALALTDFSIAGTSLGLNLNLVNPLIIDTGTSDFLVVDAIYNRITGAIAADANFVANFGSDYFDIDNPAGCVVAKTNATAKALDALLPPLRLTFTAADGTPVGLEMPATQSYLVPVPSQAGDVYYCPGIASLGASSNLSIMGNAFMRGRVLIFDAAGKQIGFAPSKDCATLATQTKVAGP
jgi:hypothetical protein